LKFEVGPGSGWGRFMDLITAVCVIIVSQCVLFAGFAWYFARQLEDAIEDLDARLAMALKATISALPFGDVEPPNPLLAILAQHLGNSVQAGGNPIVEAVVRDKKGQFVSNNE